MRQAYRCAVIWCFRCDEIIEMMLISRQFVKKIDRMISVLTGFYLPFSEWHNLIEHSHTWILVQQENTTTTTRWGPLLVVNGVMGRLQMAFNSGFNPYQPGRCRPCPMPMPVLKLPASKWPKLDPLNTDKQTNKKCQQKNTPHSNQNQATSVWSQKKRL